MKNKTILIIALIALIAFTTMPVQAYTELWTTTIAEVSEPPWDNIKWFDVANGAYAAQNVTMAKWEGKCKSDLATTPSSGSAIYYLYESNAKHGGVTITWSGVAQSPSWGSCTITVEPYPNPTWDFYTHTGAVTWLLANSSSYTNSFGVVHQIYGRYVNETGGMWYYNNPKTVGMVLSGTNNIYQLSGKHTVYSGTNVVAPVASFSAIPESGYQPLTVNFTDTSTPGTSPITSWQWDFDDGYASTTQNAEHTFHLNGTYNTSLTVSDGSLYSTAYKNITVGLAPAIPGSYTLTVHVKDKSGVNMNHAHISLLPSSGPVLTNYTNAAGISNFIAVPGSAAAIIDVTMTGYPEYIETFTLATDMTKEITLGTSGVKLYVDVKDSIYGNILNGVNIGIQNTTSGVWRNATGHSGSIYYDSTGASYEHPLSIGQTVVVAASKAGYRSDSKSVTIPSDQYTVTLQLVNINGSAPSSGNFTAVIAAGSMVTGLEIPGASITINELGRMQATNEGGVAMFFNVPVGSYTLHVSAPGYQSVTDDITGTNQETVMKRVNLLPDGYRRDENNTIIGPGGTPIIPGGPFWSSNTSANERAAEGVSSFLDNIVSIGMLILILILFWFIKKIFFS